MKKISTLLFTIFLAFIMHAQDRPQPKPAKAPVVNIKKPKTFTLTNGLKVMIVEDHKLPRVSFSLTLDNAPFAEGDKKGVDQLTSSMIGNGSKSIPKEKFNEEIDFYGASTEFSSQSSFASCLSKFSYRVLELMAEAALNPNFTEEELDIEKARTLEHLKSQEKSVGNIANRVGEVLAFGKNHPFGEYITEETLKNISLTDIEKNYKDYFVPENAYLVVIGDVNYTKIQPEIERLFGNWKKSRTPKASYADPTNVPFTQINFVDVPTAVQSEIALLNTVNLKMNDPDFIAASIAGYILGGDFNGYLTSNLREKNGFTYYAESYIGAGKYVSKVKSNAAVRNMVTDSAVVEFIKEIKRIRTEKVSQELLANVKAGYIGRFVMRVQKPQTIARYALNIETENLPANFYENYIQSINAVTADQVLAAAKKYLLIDNTRIVVVGKASEALPGLQKLNIPISYFDQYGNPTENPLQN